MMKISSTFRLSTFAGLLVIILCFGVVRATLAEAYIFKRNLSFGSIGQDVKELQKFLNANNFILTQFGLGSLGKETSFFGPLTRAALIKFQKAKKIVPAVGFFGPITRAELNKEISQTDSNSLPISTPTVPHENKQYFSVGGSVTGLVSAVTLQNNGGDDITIKPGDDSNFIFPTKVADGTSYNITIKPGYIGQKCYIYNNFGTIHGADFKAAKIACGASLFFNPFAFVSNGGSSTTVTEQFTCGEDLVDTRDSQSYSTVLIGNQCWMSENFNFGDRVNGAVNQADADGSSAEKYCYGDDPDKCESDGGLYQWHTALAFPQICSNHLNSGDCLVAYPRRGICPSGWHVPSFNEMKILSQISDPGCDLNCDSGFCSCTSGALKMKADPAHLPISWDGTNIYDLSIIPSGIRASDGSFSRYGVSVNLWTSTPLSGGDTQYSWFASFFGTGNEFAVPPDTVYGGLNYRSYGYSLRCVKD